MCRRVGRNKSSTRHCLVPGQSDRSALMAAKPRPSTRSGALARRSLKSRLTRLAAADNLDTAGASDVLAAPAQGLGLS
eukprot:scaffold61328_cov68-Phaeocystis_antarctica.AAC.4